MEPDNNPNIITKIIQHSDIAIAVGVIGILLMMIVPIPAMMLDLMLSINITLALVILLVVLYTTKPVDFSIFPSLLLVVTLFRLSLNVASTRLILLNGNLGEQAAGNVIRSFGKFVIGGNYVVGFVVFIILVVINFVVITKGAGRIAEVNARFTLDAMPLKQMAIDTDLTNEIISEEEARERRKMVEMEADFYGAMDGASKFVRGDAVAGIIITAINILGGLIIGVLQHKMNLASAAKTYSLLTIGDGLVSQVPALIISTGAAILITRVGTESDFGKTLTSQFLLQPRALAIAAGMLVILGITPGLPKIPFLTLAGITSGIAYLAKKQQPAELPAIKEEDEAEAAAVAADDEANELKNMLEVDAMGVNIGYKLISLVGEEGDGILPERIKIIRRSLAQELGFIVPPIRIKDDIENLPPNGYSISIRDNVVASGELIVNHYLAMEVGPVTEKMEGIETQEPTNNSPALWITEENKERAQLAGYLVVDAAAVLATHLIETIKRHAHELLTRQDTKDLIDGLEESNPALIKELVPDALPLGIIQKVLQNLLKESVPIRNMIPILETLADNATEKANPIQLTEYVRWALARSICDSLVSDDGTLSFIGLDEEIETTIANAIDVEQGGQTIPLSPNFIQQIIGAIANTIAQIQNISTIPIILCSATIRPYLKRLLERDLSHSIAVLSREEIQEIGTDVTIRNIGRVSLS